MSSSFREPARKGPKGWSISDEVVQLRQRGTSQAFKLIPRAGQGAAPAGVLVLGNDASCDIYIAKPFRLSRALRSILFRRDGQWHVAPSLGTLRVDGEKAGVVRLEPGAHIRFGSMTLIAESPGLLRLQSFLRRLLGWGWGDRREFAVERAIHVLRDAQRYHLPVVLRGEGGLLPIAEELHRRTLPSSAPFVERRMEHLHSEALVAAITQARGGTLCLEVHETAPAWVELVERARHLASGRVQLVVCRSLSAPALPYRSTQLNIPPLHTRTTDERTWLVRECFIEAALELASACGKEESWPHPGTPEEVSWVLAHGSSNVAEILRTTRQIVVHRAIKTNARHEVVVQAERHFLN